MRKPMNKTTYKEFEKVINETENYSFEYSDDKVHVFYDYRHGEQVPSSYSIRQPLFTISLIKAFEIIAPYGYRFVGMKQLKDFSKIEQISLDLSNTPICFRE